MKELGQDGTNPRTHRETVPAGATSQLIIVSDCVPPISLMVVPSPGARAVVETTRSTEYWINSGDAFWTPWGGGEATSQTPADLLSREYALRVIAIDGPVTFEVLV
ncbi:hypothetical protein [Endothiovibrio diazotrophicus]